MGDVFTIDKSMNISSTSSEIPSKRLRITRKHRKYGEMQTYEEILLRL